MKITDIISITELSRLLNKSRPTVYKYISDFENGNHAALPHSVKKLFENVQSGNLPKREIYEYCEYWFNGTPTPSHSAEKKEQPKPVTLKELIKTLKAYEKYLDLTKIKNFIEQEIKK